MKRTIQFMALRPDPEDDTRTSVEMLNMPNPYHDHHRSDSDYEPRKLDRHDPQMTLRGKFAPFPWKSFFVISSLPFALAPIVILSTAAEEVSRSYIMGRDCYPNGMWAEQKGSTWEIMDSTYFFTPNLSFGSFNFTDVKVIDIAWDLLIGRGGQLLLAYVNYRVFNEWILYHMELHLTSYKLFTALSFETTTLTTLGVLGKEFLAFGENNWRRFFRWLAILSMFLSTFYVLSFPTLMAAMTGYITTYEAYIEDYDKNLIEVSKFQRINYVIQDSHRLGYEKPLLATREDPELMNAVWYYVGNSSRKDEFHRVDPHFINESSWGSMGGPSVFSANESSIWTFEGKKTPLESPTLNISWYLTWESDAFIQQAGAITNGGRQGDVYNGNYLLSHGSCKPNELYQWGFSYIFLFMVSIFNFVWSCIMVGMWFDTSRSSRMYKSGRRPGLLRRIMDVSAVIREELGDRVDNMEEDELRKALRDSGGALMVPKKELRIARTRTGEEDVRKRGWRRRMTKGSTF